MLSAWSDLCHIAAFHSNKEQEWLMVVIKLFYFTNILIGVPLFCFECSQQGHIFREIPPKQSFFFFVFYSSLFSKVNTTAHWVLINCHYWLLRLLWLCRLSFVMVKIGHLRRCNLFKFHSNKCDGKNSKHNKPKKLSVSSIWGSLKFCSVSLSLHLVDYTYWVAVQKGAWKQAVVMMWCASS